MKIPRSQAHGKTGPTSALNTGRRLTSHSIAGLTQTPAYNDAMASIKPSTQLESACAAMALVSFLTPPKSAANQIILSLRNGRNSQHAVRSYHSSWFRKSVKVGHNTISTLWPQRAPCLRMPKVHKDRFWNFGNRAPTVFQSDLRRKEPCTSSSSYTQNLLTAVLSSNITSRSICRSR